MKRLTAAALLGLSAPVAWSGAASANTCRALEMQLAQAQARGGGEAASMHDLLVDRGCRRARRAKVEPRATPVRLERPERPVRSKRPEKTERRTARKERRARRPEASDPGQPIAVSDETFRTLCVRTCDGYYFPISFSTTKEHFAADQAACQQMCPASETGLYYYSRANQGPENMLSLTGDLYTSLPTAFRYRASLDESCTCSAPRPPIELATASREAPADLSARLPSVRPEPGEDPETIANRDGHFIPGPVDPAVAGNPGLATPIRSVVPPPPAVTLLTPVPN